MSKIHWSVAFVLGLGLSPAAWPQAITVLRNFAGIPADHTAPPDTTGKAGTTQFVQWVNTEFAVYDKATGRQLQARRPGNSLWTGFGGPCETMNSGHPMVEWDKLAGRWVLAQLALSNPAYYCFAISTSADATGTYYLYAFPIVVGMNPSSPRLGVWPDAYYASFNIQPAGKRAAPLVVAYDRLNMLAGQPARGPVSFQPAARTNLLPADFDGPIPPTTGEPEFYAGVGSSNLLNLYQFHVDFSSAGGSSFTALPAVSVQSTGIGCSRNPPQWTKGVVSQPATTVLLNAQPDQLMYRLAWRNVQQTEHLVSNQTVILSDTPVLAGVAWYDLVRNASGQMVLAQQGTVSNSAANYWMGSVGQDKDGNIVLGFNASGPNTFPSIAMAGRLATDPPGTMFPAVFLAQGGGAQTNTSKWGTHADLSLDPNDDCAFWFTTEYVKTAKTSGFDWSTQIIQVRLNGCQ